MNGHVEHHQQPVRPVMKQTSPGMSAAIMTADALVNDAPVEVPEQFAIDNADKASWAVRKILEAQAYAARVKSWAETELRRAEHEEQWLLRRFGAELEGWLRGELQRGGGRRRCANLPAGTVGFRQQPARLEVVDEAELFTWCLTNLHDALRVAAEVDGSAVARILETLRRDAPDARVRQRVLLEPLHRHFGDSGEIPPGTVLRVAEDRLYVK